MSGGCGYGCNGVVFRGKVPGAGVVPGVGSGA